MQPETAVHLSIDMQRLFAAHGPWPTPWMERVLPKIVRLVEHAPERTVFTRFLTPRTPDDMPGMWKAYYRKWSNVTRDQIDPSLLNLMPDLQRFVPPAHVYDKYVYSAFGTGELHTLLRARQINTLVISGSETDVCVASTVLSAIDIGYKVIVARDAICSSSDESHDALLGLYKKRFSVQVTVAEVDEILDRWRL